MKKQKKRKKTRGAPSVRLPLPKKGEKRHADQKKYDRARERERLRREHLENLR